MKRLRNSRKYKVKSISVVLLSSVLFVYYYLLTGNEISEEHNSFLLITVATELHNSVKRFERSAAVNGLPLKVLGLGTKYEGYGMKVNLIKEELKRHLDDPGKIILVADSHDVLINARVNQIIKTFKNFNANIVFSAEGNCWPDASLASRHPPVAKGKRYLNSGLIIAYAADFYRLLTLRTIANDGNDQLHYQNIYIDDVLRQKLNIKLDHRSEIFQNLYQALNEVELRFKGTEAYVKNVAYDTSPLIIHGNGDVKSYIDTLGNYIPKAWNPKDGCTACLERTIKMSNLKEYEYPSVLLGVFVKKNESNIDKFITKLVSLSYPPNKIQIFLYKKEELLTNISDQYLHHYSDVKTVYQVDEETAKEMAVNEFLRRGCDYYFYVDNDVYLDNAETLQLLIEQNRPIVAPLLQDFHASRTNFKGALQPEFYPSSMDILKNNHRGLWKVPHVSNCYLIQGAIMSNPNTRPLYVEMNGLDSDASFCFNMRLRDVEMFITNRFDFGHFR